MGQERSAGSQQLKNHSRLKRKEEGRQRGMKQRNNGRCRNNIGQGAASRETGDTDLKGVPALLLGVLFLETLCVAEQGDRGQKRESDR
jgi:hypothetical protein